MTNEYFLDCCNDMLRKKGGFGYVNPFDRLADAYWTRINIANRLGAQMQMQNSFLAQMRGQAQSGRVIPARYDDDFNVKG